MLRWVFMVSSDFSPSISLGGFMSFGSAVEGCGCVAALTLRSYD
jgi:hypothetical protein